MEDVQKKYLWNAAFFFLICSALAMGFGLVWLNVERNKLAYSLRKSHEQREALMDVNAKLDNEIGALLAPHVLVRKAEAFGMHMAKPNQVWRVGEQREKTFKDF